MVEQRADQAYAEWLKADTEARQAERRLRAAWIAYDMDGEMPSEALLAEVSRLRTIAIEKQNAAVAALARESDRKE